MNATKFVRVMRIRPSGKNRAVIGSRKRWENKLLCLGYHPVVLVLTAIFADLFDPYPAIFKIIMKTSEPSWQHPWDS